MRRLTIIFFFLVAATFLGSSEKIIQWQKLYEKQGVEVFTANVQGSKLVAFKGIVTIDASPDLIVDIFKDATRWGEWTDLLIEGRILTPLRKSSLFFYQSFKSPPFIADRDAVYEVSFEGPNKHGVVKVTGVSSTHPNSPPTVGVRMKIDFSKWVLTPHNEKTVVQLEMHADPGGLIPSWVVNLVQKKYPYDLLSSLRRHVNRVIHEGNFTNR